MTAERFEGLASAYGGDVGRWPHAERLAAEAWRQAHPAEAATVLAEASALDALLDASRVAPPSPILRDRIVGAALAARPAARRLVWASATGLLAACAAGALFGAHYSSRLLSDPAADSMAQTVTAFDGAGRYFDTTTTTTSAGNAG